jgi:hypothetical protein
LGILNLERFARALRLCWLWFRWKQKYRPWNKLELPCDSKDKELFAASTVVTIGNGKFASFWTSSWIGGRAPKIVAPTLFRKAKRKNITVQMALLDNSWITHILPILTPQELNEYVTLWEAVSQTRLVENKEDTIYWQCTSDGKYTTKSAYNIQFQGTFSKLRIMPIWKAKAEPKCRFFT